MRNKRFNNNLTDSISKGGVLYRAGEIPTLNKEQIAQANLVSKLPRDFPFANWESMNTKQQLQQMQHSGLNDQDQWSLLNANVPLSVLDQHNRAQDEINTRASATRIATSLMNAVAQASVPRTQATVSKPTISTSLQNAALNGQLGGAVDSLSGNLKSVFLKDEFEQKNGTMSAKIPGEVLAKIQHGDQSPAPLPTPNPNPPPSPTPSPNETPLPEAGPSLDTYGVDTSYISEESRKILEQILSRMKSSVVSPELYSNYFKELNNIREEEEKNKYFEKIKFGAPTDAAWGTEMIYDQRIYYKVSGTFGPWGNIPENVCGVAAIQNANQILGINTRFDELIYSIQKEYQVTTNLFGKLGMSIDALCGYYINAGATVTDYDSRSRIPNNHDAYIVMYSYRTSDGTIGAHYVAAEYDKSNGCFKVYNDIKKVETWDTLLPSSYQTIAGQYGHDDKILVWNVFGIDLPKIPKVKNMKAPIGKTGTPVTRKGAWRRTSK